MKDKEAKAWGQWRLQLNSQILRPLRLYGQGHTVDGALVEIERITKQLVERLNGNDVPIVARKVKW